MKTIIGFMVGEGIGLITKGLESDEFFFRRDAFFFFFLIDDLNEPFRGIFIIQDGGITIDEC